MTSRRSTLQSCAQFIFSFMVGRELMIMSLSLKLQRLNQNLLINKYPDTKEGRENERGGEEEGGAERPREIQ